MFRDLTAGEAGRLYRKMRRAHYRARFGWEYSPPDLQIMFDCDDVLLELERWWGADVIDSALSSGRGGRHRAA